MALPKWQLHCLALSVAQLPPEFAAKFGAAESTSNPVFQPALRLLPLALVF
jgi:hypothetical protein